MKIEFFGVLGSVPGGHSNLSKNTTCILIKDGTYELIIDAGSGINQLFEKSNNLSHHILFTHYHLDHVIGLPFAMPLFSDEQDVHLYGGVLDGFSVDDLLPSLLRKPLLPISMEEVQCDLHYHFVKPSQNINSFDVKSMRGEHPGEVMVYSIEKDGKKICVLTDVEGQTLNDIKCIELCANSDIIYIDGNSLQVEIEKGEKSLGHPTIEQAIDFFHNTMSKKLLVGHHKRNRVYCDLMKYENNDIKIVKEGNVFFL